MKKNINQFFVGPISKITDITHETIFEPYIDTLTTHHLINVDSGCFYQYDEDKFIEIRTKTKYNSNIHSSDVGDLVIDKRRLTPVLKFCNDLNIELPNKNKISQKQLIKSIKKAQK